MAYCVKCGTKIVDGAKFCGECGSKVGEGYNSVSERKEFFDGEKHKCPMCGEILNSFQYKCICGYEIRGVKSASSVLELSEKLQELERQRSTFKYKLVSLGNSKQDFILKQKIEIINTFPIPNTKEDLFEFAILAKSHIVSADRNGDGKLNNVERELFMAWNTKLEQCYDKASIVFTNEKDILKIQEIVDSVCNLKHYKILRKTKGSNVAGKVGWGILNVYTLGIPAIIASAAKKNRNKKR